MHQLSKRPCVLGLILARGGSKSIPQKNIALLAGKPLIAYTIQAALCAQGIDRVVVSTDSTEIANVVHSYGAEVPFLRPQELARDDTSSIDAMVHAVQWLVEEEKYQPDYVMLLQPTSPFRAAQDIEKAIELSQEWQADSVISVCSAKHHPYWMVTLEDNMQVNWLVGRSKKYVRRQDLNPTYAVNGAIYLIRCDVFLERHSLYPPRTLAYVMPVERSLDVDTPWDMHLAELIIKGDNR